MTLKRFLIHLGSMGLFILVVFFGILLWLRAYTHHGQKIELPDYRGMHIEEAGPDAKDKSFEIIVNDSLFKVGVEGGTIINQNPVPGSLVKEKRKVYVDIARYSATTNKLEDLPIMYGREYNSVSRSLAHLEIDASIKSYKYDAGEPDHILEVWYEDKLIDGKEGRKTDIAIKTGGSLEFVLSKREGGEVAVPDLVCDMLGNAKWKLGRSQLKLGRIEKRGLITCPLDSAFIVQQMPVAGDSSRIMMGQSINVIVMQERPDNCF